MAASFQGAAQYPAPSSSHTGIRESEPVQTSSIGEESSRCHPWNTCDILPAPNQGLGRCAARAPSACCCVDIALSRLLPWAWAWQCKSSAPAAALHFIHGGLHWPAAMNSCSQGIAASCRSTVEAEQLKCVAIVAILFSGALGVLLPLWCRSLDFLRSDSRILFVAKVFAAGVILATGFVHVLSEGQEFLTHPCLDPHPWSLFPFAGFLAMCGSLITLLAHFAATHYCRREHLTACPPAPAGTDTDVPAILDAAGRHDAAQCHVIDCNLQIAHPAEEQEQMPEKQQQDEKQKQQQEEVKLVHVPGPSWLHLVSQVLELGIVSTHAVIIGVGLGVSNSPCSIRALVAVLVVHQLFEGLAVGGSIAQAGFRAAAAWVMAVFFSVTTPMGIGIGLRVQRTYNLDSSVALVVEGTFNSISAGILIYMALVDLIATAFLSQKLRSDVRLQVYSHIALIAGAALTTLFGRSS